MHRIHPFRINNGRTFTTRIQQFKKMAQCLFFFQFFFCLGIADKADLALSWMEWQSREWSCLVLSFFWAIGAAGLGKWRVCITILTIHCRWWEGIEMSGAEWLATIYLTADLLLHQLFGCWSWVSGQRWLQGGWNGNSVTVLSFKIKVEMVGLVGDHHCLTFFDISIVCDLEAYTWTSFTSCWMQHV